MLRNLNKFILFAVFVREEGYKYNIGKIFVFYTFPFICLFVLLFDWDLGTVSVQFSTVAQSCPTLCNSMDCFPVHHQLLELTQTHIHRVSDAIQPSHPLSSTSPPAFNLQSFPGSGSIQMSQLFVSGGQSIGVSASTSVLPMNTQDWFPLGWTGWISLQSKGPSRVFSNTTVQKHQFFGPQLSL